MKQLLMGLAIWGSSMAVFADVLANDGEGATAFAGVTAVNNGIPPFGSYTVRRVAGNWQWEVTPSSGSNSNNLANYFQDMKNFLALTLLKQNQQEAALRYTPPPFFDTTVFLGGKASEAHGKQTQPLDEFLFGLEIRNLTSRDKELAIGLAPEVDELDIVNKHFSTYCNEQEAKAKLCDPATATGPYPADLEARTLLGTEDFLNRTKTVAAQDYITNLTNIKPSPMLSRSEMIVTNPDTGETKFTDAGLEQLLNRFKQQTLLSLAQYSLSQLYAERLPYTTTTDKSSFDAIKNTSELGAISYDVKRRYEDPNWYKSMNGLSAEAISRETANMMALQLMLSYKQYEQNSRIEALLASQVALQAEQFAGE